MLFRSVTSVADGLYDPNETVVITMTGVTGNAGLGTVKTHTLTLSEAALSVEFVSSSSSLNEGNTGKISYNISLPSGVTPSVSVGGTATEGTDYTYAVTQTGVTITATDDGLYDPSETVTVTLTGVSGNAVLGTLQTHTVTLTEAALVVEFTGTSSAVGESGSGTVAFNQVLPAGVTPSITFGGTATQGTDYSYSLSQSGVTVTATADGLYDPNETVIITLSGVSGNRSEAHTSELQSLRQSRMPSSA